MRYAELSTQAVETEAEPEPAPLPGGGIMGDAIALADAGEATHEGTYEGGTYEGGLMHPHPTTAELPAVLDAAKRPPSRMACEDCGAMTDVTEDTHVCAHCCAPLPGR